MKVKVVKLDDRYDGHLQEQKEMIGKVFDALRFRNDYDKDFKDYYALGLENGVYHIPAQCCEVVEELVMANNSTKGEPKTSSIKRILLVEDGSVDIDKLEQDGFYVIPYRQGSVPPICLNKGE
ncbi:hypothetical protein IJE86_08025 [bacterium]|nr:hypothetical protein [bacterium]